METFQELIGQGKDLGILQMAIRAVLIFFIAYILIRISGRRSFGLQSPLDNIIVILLGSILSRAVVGVSPFIPVIGACITVVFLHRVLGWLISQKPKFSNSVQGGKILLYDHNGFHAKNMEKSLIGKEEIFRALRVNMQTEEMSLVAKIYMEQDGIISIIKREL